MTQGKTAASVTAGGATVAGTVPATIGQYKVIGELARGGMGVVYRAVHPGLKRQVVIKKLTMKANNTIVERFKREAQILLDLKNPNIVHLHDYFVEGNFHYIVLEYVDGMSLDKLIRKQGYLSPQTAMLIFRDACRALDYAHEHGVIHRDIKPANILMSRHGDIKLADFGIASTEVDGEESTLTQTGVALGTPSYMPPEQFSASHTVDKRADIYAMGVMLYEMVTGTKPYPGKFTAETLADIQKGNYTPPDKKNSAIPKVICALIKKMLKTDPKKRYQSIKPILKKVEKYLSDYDIDDIKTQLSFNLSQPVGTKLAPYQEKKFVERGHIFKIVSRTILWTAVAALFLAGLWHVGFFYRSILRPWYTPVTLVMKVPQTATPNADLPIKAFFFKDDNDTIPELEQWRMTFSQHHTLDTVYSLWDSTVGAVIRSITGNPYDVSSKSYTGDEENPLYHTKPVYLRPGEYRVKIVTGSYVWWKSITVGSKEMSIPVITMDTVHKELQIHSDITDASTGEPVEGAVICMKYKGEYVPLRTVPASELISGSVIKLQAQAPGYESQNFSLLIEWYQEEVFLNARLKKL